MVLLDLRYPSVVWPFSAFANKIHHRCLVKVLKRHWIRLSFLCFFKDTRKLCLLQYFAQYRFIWVWILYLFFCKTRFASNNTYYPVDTGRKLNVHKKFRTRPGRLLNVLCTLNLRPVSTGSFYYYANVYNTAFTLLNAPALI